MFIVPSQCPEGYAWFVALAALVGPYFVVRDFMWARR
jgi:hypothetical protein